MIVISQKANKNNIEVPKSNRLRLRIKPKSSTILTCNRARIVSMGLVIRVVENPASTPDILCKNKSEVFTGHLFSS